MGWDPEKRMQKIFESPSTDLDALYTAILDEHFGPGTAMMMYQRIMGRVLLLCEPLSMDDLSELWYDEEDRNQAHVILRPLGSLLAGVSLQDRGKRIQPLHILFLDYLRDKNRSKKY